MYLGSRTVLYSPFSSCLWVFPAHCSGFDLNQTTSLSLGLNTFNQRPLTKMSLWFFFSLFFSFIYIYIYIIQQRKKSKSSLRHHYHCLFPLWFPLPALTKTSETLHSSSSYLHHFLLAWTFNKQTVPLHKIPGSSDPCVPPSPNRFHLFPVSLQLPYHVATPLAAALGERTSCSLQAHKTLVVLSYIFQINFHGLKL